jgi:hypothetical protein
MADTTNFSQMLENVMNQNINSGVYANNTQQSQVDQAKILSNLTTPAANQIGGTGGAPPPQPNNGAQQIMTAEQAIGKNQKAGSAAAASSAAAAPVADADAGEGGAIDVMSDKKLKTNIKKTMDADINDFLKSLTPQSFDYKDPMNGSRTEAGVMAQDLEKSKIGSSVIKETGKGKAIDTAKLAPLMAGIFSQKINELEQKVNASLDAKFKGKK